MSGRRGTPRIVSLLSSATEIVYALGLEGALTGISHECDYPAEALALPRLSRSRFDPSGMSSGEIDAAVREAMASHGSMYEIDVGRLAELRPDIILTQAVCEVCAVPAGSVEAAVAEMPRPPLVVSLDAHTLGEMLATVQQVADAAGASANGRQVVAGLQSRIDNVSSRVAEGGEPRPRALALEWLDPPFAPGHWLPEMIDAAGAECLTGAAGEPSLATEWARLAGLDPDLLLLLPCGFDLEQACADAARHRERLEQVAPRAIARGTWVGHGAFFNRSGPRLIDGIEALGRAFHPNRFDEPPRAGILERWS